MKRVLVTGCCGAIGRPVCRELASRGYQVRGLDRAPDPEREDSVLSDIQDRAGVREAMREVDSVVHLAAQPWDTDFDDLVGPNVVGLHNVLDAARQEGVRRVVLASSVQTLGARPPGSPPARVDERSPRNHYGLTKVWAEQMAEMYVRCYGASIVAVRVAWMVRDRREAERIVELDYTRAYLSRRDVARCFALAVAAPDIDFAVVYAVGPEGAELYDLEPARRLLGFEPEDRWPAGANFDGDEP
jgi:uronate dehydrogenase